MMFAQYDVCSNECILYRGTYTKYTECPTCQHPRYMNFNENNNNNNNDVTVHAKSCKTYRYFPIASRLRQLFSNKLYSTLFKYADSHMHDYRTMDDNSYSYDKMEDICHTPLWRSFAKQFPLYSEDNLNGKCDRRVGFILSLDSASMSKFLSPDFSITPFILGILNFPVWFRCKPQHMLFTGISPANAKNTSLYLGTYFISHFISYKHAFTYAYLVLHAFVCNVDSAVD